MRVRLSGWAVAAAGILLFGSVATLASASQSAPRAGASDWTQYTDDLAGSGDNANESALNPRNAHTLHAAWVVKGGRSVSAQPLVVGGVVYWGSLDGVLHATSLATHASLWTRALGFTTCARCSAPSI